MKIKWLGQSAFIFNYDGYKIITDPWIRNNPVCRTPVEELYDIDAILVTHGHFDHFGDCIELMENSRARLVCDPEISWYMSRYGYIRNERLFPVAQGGAVLFDGVRVSMVPAIHPSAIYGSEWQSEQKWLPNSAAVGYMVEHSAEPTIYHAGDTALFSDMALFAKRFQPGISLLPIGGRFTMDAEDAVEAVGFLKSKYIIPMHYNTNPELKADVHAFKTAVESRYCGTNVLVLNPGDEIRLP
ncbi:MAG: metal-dependent hydrolase [Candidatus Heteroscillospira sp.]|jgi:L-ascorbate metabolism protein UlaG (beta-lactamase superfamily)